MLTIIITCSSKPKTETKNTLKDSSTESITKKQENKDNSSSNNENTSTKKKETLNFQNFSDEEEQKVIKEIDLTGAVVDVKYSNGPVRYVTPSGEYIVDLKDDDSYMKEKKDGTKISYFKKGHQILYKFKNGDELVIFLKKEGTNQTLKRFTKVNGEKSELFGNGDILFTFASGLSYKLLNDGNIQPSPDLNKILFYYSNNSYRTLAYSVAASLIEKHPNSLFTEILRGAIDKKIELANIDKVCLFAYNYLRQKSRLKPVTNNTILRVTALNHARYVSLNKIMGHIEKKGTRHFTGETPTDRMKSAGFSGSGGEVVSYIGNPISDVINWVYTLYHRFGVLHQNISSIGYGTFLAESEGGYDTGVIDYGVEKECGISVFSYPYNKMENVPIAWNGFETPDPIPNKSKPVGFPITVTFDIIKVFSSQNDKKTEWEWKGLAFQDSKLELFDDDGNKVEGYNDFGDYQKDTFCALIPKKPLYYETKYKVVYTYKIDGQEKKYEWMFTTTQKPVNLDHLY